MRWESPGFGFRLLLELEARLTEAKEREPVPTEEGSLPPGADISEQERHAAVEREAERRQHEES
jgi:hypothetical protein